MKPLKELKKNWIKRGTLVLLFLFFGFTSFGADALRAVEFAVATAASPVTDTLGTGLNYVGEGANSLIHVTSLSAENKRMKKELTELKRENKNLEDIVNRSTFLSNAYAIRNNRKLGAVDARVTAKSSGMYFHRFTINKGSKAGISAGDTVIAAMTKGDDASAEGVIGYVTKVTPYSAQVRSIIDEENAISFRSIRTSDGGVLRGVNRRLEGYAFDLYADIVVGDTLFTTGIGDGYAPDMYIGTVSEVSTDEDKMVKNIKVDSGINFHNIYRVFVLAGGK